LTADALSRLELERTRLVVLSACRTVRGGRSRASGFTGLSGALLAAGAAGVVGSTWEVDDWFTAAFMPRFHDAYRARVDAAHALRTAQITFIRSSDATFRTPAAWAGFRYVGD
jgi:CHAT domain-containing protein